MGAGAETARWSELVCPADYRAVVVLNGAVQCGIPYTHYLCLDENAIRFKWLKLGIEGAAQCVILSVNMDGLARTWVPRTTRLEQYAMKQFRIDFGVVAEDLGYKIKIPPTEDNALLCMFTVSCAGLHYIAHMDGIGHIDVLGCGNRMIRVEGHEQPFYHFYDIPHTPMSVKDVAGHEAMMKLQRRATFNVAGAVRKHMGIEVRFIGEDEHV